MAGMINNIENMNKRTRMVLSLVGVSAVVVPAVLLLVVSSRTLKEPEVGTNTRSVDTGNIEKTVKLTPSPAATPKIASSSALPAESTSSGR